MTDREAQQSAQTTLDDLDAILWQCNRGNVSLLWLIDAVRGLAERLRAEPPQLRAPLSEWQIVDLVQEWQGKRASSLADLIQMTEAAHGIKPAGDGS